MSEDWVCDLQCEKCILQNKCEKLGGYKMTNEEKKAIEWLKKADWFSARLYAPTLLNLINKQQKEINKLKQENHNLKQELKVYIPRRRVRRVYKMIGKILKQDGVTDDLDELLEE